MSYPLYSETCDTQLISKANDDSNAPDPTEINVEAHFSVIDAFDMPAVHFDAVRGGFTTCVQLRAMWDLANGHRGKSKSLGGQPSSRSAFLRERWGIIKEVCPPCSPHATYL